MQAGVAGGADPRATMPDVEAALGLSSDIELELDGTLGWDAQQGRVFRPVENTWASLKLRVADVVDPETKDFWAAGVQVGPKLPTMQGARGLGLESLAIVGRGQGPAHVYAQLGVLLDPWLVTAGAGRVRPFALEGGVDLDVDLDHRDRWSFTAELGASRFFAPRYAEIHATAGIACNVVPTLEVALLGIGGYSQGTQLGVLVGVTPRFAVF